MSITQVVCGYYNSAFPAKPVPCGKNVTGCPCLMYVPSTYPRDIRSKWHYMQHDQQLFFSPDRFPTVSSNCAPEAEEDCGEHKQCVKQGENNTYHCVCKEGFTTLEDSCQGRKCKSMFSSLCFYVFNFHFATEFILCPLSLLSRYRWLQPCIGCLLSVYRRNNLRGQLREYEESLKITCRRRLICKLFEIIFYAFTSAI